MSIWVNVVETLSKFGILVIRSWFFYLINTLVYNGANSGRGGLLLLLIAALHIPCAHTLKNSIIAGFILLL